MDTFSAFINASVARANGNPMRQIDWEKARDLINEFKEKNPGVGFCVDAGLSGDMDNTGGIVYLYDEVDDKDTWYTNSNTYVYGASVWATPILIFTVYHDDDSFDETTSECWKYGNETDIPEWWGKEVSK